MRLDGAMPRRERHGVPCDASPAAVTRATEEVTLREVPVFWGFMTPILIGHARLRAILRRALPIDRAPGATPDYREERAKPHEQRPG